MNTSNAQSWLVRIIFGWFFLLGGLVIIAAGLILLVKTDTFVKRASKIPGTVIEMNRVGPSRKGIYTYESVATFADASGIIHTQRTSFGSASGAFKPGEKITVLYDSATPEDSKLDSFLVVWSVPLIVTGTGLAFVGFSCLTLFMENRKMRLQQEQNDT